MGSWSIGHWIVVLLVILLLFGAGKIPHLMGDMAKGIKAFKKGMKDDEDVGSTHVPSDEPKIQEKTMSEIGKDRNTLHN